MKQTDEQLLDLIQAGDEQAFNILYNKYYKYITKRIFKMCKNDEISQDVYQETMVRVFLNLNDFERRCKFRTWVYTIAFRVYFNIAKRKDSKHYPIKFEEATTRNPLNTYIEAESRELVKNAIKYIPKKQKQILIYRLYDGGRFVDLAKTSGIKYNTIKANYRHAVNSFKTIWENQNNNFTKVDYDEKIFKVYKYY